MRRLPRDLSSEEYLDSSPSPRFAGETSETRSERVRGCLHTFDSRKVPLTRIASQFDLSPQAGRGEPPAPQPIDTKRGGRAMGPPFVSNIPCRFTSSPGRGFRRPDWPRYEC